jgi:hypothetical protein
MAIFEKYNKVRCEFTAPRQPLRFVQTNVNTFLHNHTVTDTHLG